jgi:hypothetical protein
MMQSKSLAKAAQTLWHIQRIKRLVRDQLGNGVQCLVLVRETICTDPKCEGPATEVRIVMLDFRETRVTIHKSLSQVSASDIAATL